jgi:hypothetical protein
MNTESNTDELLLKKCVNHADVMYCDPFKEIVVFRSNKKSSEESLSSMVIIKFAYIVYIYDKTAKEVTISKDRYRDGTATEAWKDIRSLIHNSLSEEAMLARMKGIYITTE